MKILKFFNSPKRWAQGAYASNNSGDALTIHSRKATCWCLSGAVTNCYRDPDKRSLVFAKLAASIRSLYPNPKYNDVPNSITVIRFNDHLKRKFGGILAVVKHAKV